MSEIEKLIPTANGDASVAEATKTDQDGNCSQLATAIKSEQAPAEEITTPNAQSKSALEINNAEIVATEITNLDTRSAESTNTIAEITEVAVQDTKENVSMIQVNEINLNSITKIANSSLIIPEEATVCTKSTADEEIDKSGENTTQTKDNNTASIAKMESEVRKRTKERDTYQRKLEDTEKKLAILQASYDAIVNHDGDNNLQQSVEQLRGQLAQTALMYEERNRLVVNQENQINALNNQVTSLKEIVSITRDLLQIRNIEVKQLQTEVDNMEKKITEERDRHNMMISKMDAAMRLNADLKKEYETQLSLFQSLREKYDQKITLLSAEKQARETNTAPISE